jgi:putative NADPH-quinone reductase
MHAHFVLAHPEPQSFNAHLVRSGSAALEAEGWTTSVSDLYAMGFDPCERPEHYRDRATLQRFDAQLEQRHASENGGLPKTVTDELAILDRADLLVLQYPMWWHLPPAMLKGWFDRVLAYGAAYTSKKRFERGRIVGKRAMLSVTVGTSRSTYEHDGRSGDINLMLWPVNRIRCRRPLRSIWCRGRAALLRLSSGRGAAEDDRRRVSRHATAHRPARHDRVQPHGGVGAGRPPRAGRSGSFAVYPSKAATRVGVTALAHPSRLGATRSNLTLGALL